MPPPLGRPACDALARTLARAWCSGDQPGTVRAVAQHIVGPTRVAAAAFTTLLARLAAFREILAVDNVAQRRMGVVAARIDDGDANSGAGQVAGLIQVHEMLDP